MFCLLEGRLKAALDGLFCGCVSSSSLTFSLFSSIKDGNLAGHFGTTSGLIPAERNTALPGGRPCASIAGALIADSSLVRGMPASGQVVFRLDRNLEKKTWRKK